jgi:hypothetical protein
MVSVSKIETALKLKKDDGDDSIFQSARVESDYL